MPVAWALDWITTPALRLVLAGAVAVALLMEWARRLPAPGRLFTALFGTMLRPHEVRGLTGAPGQLHWFTEGRGSNTLATPLRA